MKLVLVHLIFSSVAFAGTNEVSCEGFGLSQERVHFDIEQGWGTQVRDAHLYTYENGPTSPTQTDYRVFNDRLQNRRWVYSGNEGVRLEVDVFPDTEPKWNKTYRATLSISSDGLRRLYCRFPQVRPLSAAREPEFHRARPASLRRGLNSRANRD